MNEDLEQKQFRQKVQKQIECPITMQEMEDPVIDKEGNTYDRKNIVRWLNTPGRPKVSPLTRNTLHRKDLKQNKNLKAIIQKFKNGEINLNNPLPNQFFDPQTGDLMTDPVIDSNGFSRERRRQSDVNNFALKNILQAYAQTAGKKQQRERRQRQQKRRRQVNIQNQGPVRARDDSMVRARDQMDIQNQVHQARRARQIAQRRARQEERQLDIQRLKQQIETIIGSAYTKERDKHVAQLLDNLYKVVSPEQHEQYRIAAYQWKVNYLEGEINKIIVHHWNEQREIQVEALLEELKKLVTPERYKGNVAYLRDWKVRSLESKINKIIGSDYNQQKKKQVEVLLEQFGKLEDFPERFHKIVVDAQSWKIRYLEGEINKIIAHEWTQQREDRIMALMADIKEIATEQAYKKDLNAVNTWKAYHLKVEIHKIINSDYNNQKENQVVALLEQLKLRQPGRHPHYQNLAIEWKNRSYPPNPANLQVVRTIGRGGFGQTDLVRDPTTNKEYIRKKGLNNYGDGNQNMRYQYKNLQYIKDKGICSQGFICPVLMYNRYNTVYILMDYLKGYKDIFDILGRLTTNQKINIGRQAIHLIQTLHHNGIVHCDFKGNNVMYNENKREVRVIDFGVSVQRRSSDRHTLKIGGHPYTDKPNRNYGQRNGIYTWSQLKRKDYWGLGIFLYMLKHGSITSPFNINNDTSLNRNAQNNELNHFYGTHNIQFFT